MSPDAVKHLRDARDAADAIARFAVGRTAADYASDEMLRSAIERKFEIVGEALGRLRRDDSQTLGRISGFQRIIGFRNVLIHGYGKINHGISWDAVEFKLPVFRREVEALLLEATGGAVAEE